MRSIKKGGEYKRKITWLGGAEPGSLNHDIGSYMESEPESPPISP